MTPEIQRVLTLSTGHLDHTELAHVDDVASFVSEYGWLISVHRDVSEAALSLRAAIALAKHHACDFVRFDADGPLVEELQSFDW